MSNHNYFSFYRTIGKLEPSYVIRKFLDAQRIHNLTAYLQALHRQSLANADHTTLLLNCYTKLKDSSKLEEFIKVCQNTKFTLIWMNDGLMLAFPVKYVSVVHAYR